MPGTQPGTFHLMVAFHLNWRESLVANINWVNSQFTTITLFERGPNHRGEGSLKHSVLELCLEGWKQGTNETTEQGNCMIRDTEARGGTQAQKGWREECLWRNNYI